MDVCRQFVYKGGGISRRPILIERSYNMKIKSLTLYKTSLDVSYSNVIDGGRDDSYTNATLKADVFDAYYSPYVIYNNANDIKSVKEVDGNCEIFIAQDYSEMLSDGYNYAIIDNGNKYFYYFIVGMESMNDGQSPSMTISLKRDAWCNNIEYFTNHVEDDSNNVVRSHFPRWYGSNNLYYPYYYKSDDGTVFTKLRKEDVLYYGGSANVVWCGVRFSRDTITDGSYASGIINTIRDITKALMPDNLYTTAQKVKISNDFANSVAEKVSNGETLLNAIKLTLIPNDDEGNAPFTIDAIFNNGQWKDIGDGVNFGASVYEAACPLYYFPVAIMTGVTDGVPNYTLSFSMVAGGSTWTYNFTDAGNIMKIFNFGAEEIQDAFLTLCPPISYSVSGSTITVNSAVGVSNKRLRNSSGTAYIFPASDTDVPGFAYITQCPVSSTSLTLNDTYINDITGFSYTSAVGSKLFNPLNTYDDVKMLEPRIYCTPYTDVVVSVGSYTEQVPIVYDRTNIKLVFAMGNKSEPNVSLFLNNMLISAYNNIGSIGKLPTSYDKWKDFGISQLINMGQSAINSYSPGRVTTTSRSSTQTTKDTGRLTTSANISKNKKGEVNRRINTIKNVEGSEETVEKLVNTSSSSPASISGAGIVGGVVRGVGQGLEIMGSATSPNMPSVLSNNNIEMQIPRVITEQWADERELYDLLANLHLYGYTHGEVKSVKNNNRVWWDFCRTEGCSLPGITNYMDRYELEDAFDRGVTKWHAELSAFGFAHTFDRNRNNVEREFVNSEDAYASFRFKSSTPSKNFGTSGYTSTVTYGGINENGATGAITLSNVPSGLNYPLYQLKFSESGNWSASCNVKFGTGSPSYGINFLGSTIQVSCGSPFTINYNCDDLVGKTFSFSCTYGAIQVWVDGVKIGEGYCTNFGEAYNTAKMIINTNGGTISSTRVFEAKGSVWTNDEVADRQLQ